MKKKRFAVEQCDHFEVGGVGYTDRRADPPSRRIGANVLPAPRPGANVKCGPAHPLEDRKAILV